MIIENVSVDLIKPYEKNPRKNDKAVPEVAASIKRVGYRTPIIVDENMVVLCGHTRLKAIKSLGWATVPFIVQYLDLTTEQKNEYRVLDNKTGEYAEWDFEMLLGDFGKEQLFDFGFDNKEMPKQDVKEDEAPAIPELPRTATGDIYQIGNHRVMCGDSTTVEDITRLFDGKVANMIHTDPPYNVDYGVSKNPRHKIKTIENDKQSPEEWELFCKALYEVFKLFNTGDIYMWGASGPEGMKMRLWLVEAGCHWSTTIIWKKDRLVLTPANYQRMYEPCFYGWFDKSSFEAGRKEVEVWEIKRPSDSKLHPTMKPLELCGKAITNSSKHGDIVFDPFLGSGSTLMACEQTGRACYSIELSEQYCDVIVQRWVNHTKNTKVILNGQEIEWPVSVI